MFFEHAGSAVAVDLKSGDVTDVFSAAELTSHGGFVPSGRSTEERRATLLARSALAVDVDPLRTFTVPEPVRASARQALRWTTTYQREIELPVIAAGTSLVPPATVREAARSSVEADLDRTDIARAEHLASGAAIHPQVVQQMHTYFSRHPKEKVDPTVWASWGGDAGKVWAAKVAQATETQDSTTAATTIGQKLAEDEEVDYDTLRLLPRAFSVINGPHTSECDGNGSCSCGGSKSSARYPSARALTYSALGGDAGRDWATRTIRRVEAEALVAAGYDPDANVDVEEEEVPEGESFDGEAPHVYSPVTSNPEVCTYCGTGEMDERHQPDAVDYDQADITPDDAHYFSETVDDPDTCEICGKAVDDTLHKQAALADYYANKTEIDAKIAETKQYWDAQVADGGEAPPSPVQAAAEIHGVDWEEFDLSDPLEELIADDDLKTAFWERRGTEEDDPLTYYAAYTGDDSLTVDQLYVSDGAMFYRFEPSTRTWEQTHLGSPAQIIELDDDTAREVVRAQSIFPDQPVDLREVDPGEALVMAEAIPGLDNEMLNRVAVVTASGVTFDYRPQVFAEDDGYTPEERAANAKKQVRDAGGRFARSGSKIAVGPQARTGTVAKIDPATQKVQVTYDDDGSSEWVPAKSTRVQPGVVDLDKIQAIPRATAHTPKALLKSLLPPMDAEAIKAVIANYPNFIEKERAGKKARDQAQKALDKESKARWEREQAKADADYKRRLEKIHAGGKSARDAIDRIYRKILPGYKRGSLTAAARKKKDEPAEVPVLPDAGGTGQPITDPAQSDVAPVYMAEVDEANQEAVLELLAMIPASTTGNQAQVLRYTATGWVNDPKVLRQLQSSSPPAIVSLDEATFNDTMTQVQAFYQTPEGKAEAEQEAKDAAASVAASAAAIWGEYGEVVEILAAGIPGIADTPNDVANVDRLKKYWTVGTGGTAKVRWNTPGDWTRCNRHLKKYMPKPGMSEGYCASLHHLMTGEWPGDRRNVGRRGSASERSQLFDVHLLSTDEVIAYSALLAGANTLIAGVEAPERADQVPTELSGSPFVIPVLAPIGIKSGDGRSFAPLSLTTRDLPLPLMWQIKTAEGHDDSVIVGRIDSMERSEDGSLVNARGVFDVGPYGQEAERLVRHKFLRGVSVDLDNFEAEARSPESVEREPGEGESPDIVRIVADDMTVTNGRVMGATLVAKPAFQEVRIELEEGQEEEEPMVADGTYIGTPVTEAETEEMVRSALTAAGIPIHPPQEWFEDPGLKQETPLTVLDDGRVYGHVATWDTEHIGLPFSTRPPRSRSNYAYFHTGLLRTEEGKDVPVGQITLAGGHAPLESDAAMAVKHYDDTASAFCDVHAGEDAYGIWVAGAMRPSINAEQVRAVRAAAPSGDWRPINGRLEMVAICQVNVPGFPTVRARVASGHVYALVAAGTSVLARIRSDADAAPLDRLIERVDALETPQREALSQARAAALARMDPVRAEYQARLDAARAAALNKFVTLRSPEAAAARERMAALMSGGEELFRDIGTDKRKEMSKKGQALPDGSYPIATVGDLKNAIRAYGRAKEGDKAKVRRHIKKRARALGKTDLIPESWAALSTPVQDVAGEVEDLAARMALIAGGACIPLILRASDETLDGISLLAAGGRYPDGSPWDPGNHPRDEKGRFRMVIAELKKDLQGEAGTQQAVEGLDEVQQAANQGDTEAAQQAAKGVLDLVDQIAKNTEDEGAVKTLREGYGNLAEAVANLPLVFGDLNEKYKFSDLPPDLQGLMQDLYKRAEQRLDPEHLAEAGGKISEFMAGGDVLSQPQISAELSRILRFLI
jgi:hypothetical protein